VGSAPDELSREASGPELALSCRSAMPAHRQPSGAKQTLSKPHSANFDYTS
jgi:hypothetical protein